MSHTYVSQATLYGAQEIIVIKSICRVVYVKHTEFERLHLLEAIVHLNAGGEAGIQGVLQPLSPPTLQQRGC